MPGLAMSIDGLMSLQSATRTVEFPIDSETSGVVVVRGLTRAEWFTVGKLAGNDPEVGKAKAGEAFMLHAGLVDPPMDMEQAKKFLDTAPMAASMPILNAIRDMSGLGEGAQKVQYKSV